MLNGNCSTYQFAVGIAIANKHIKIILKKILTMRRLKFFFVMSLFTLVMLFMLTPLINKIYLQFEKNYNYNSKNSNHREVE